MRTIINEVVFIISLSTKNTNGKYGYPAGFPFILTGLYHGGFDYGNMVGRRNRTGDRGKL